MCCHVYRSAPTKATTFNTQHTHTHVHTNAIFYSYYSIQPTASSLCHPPLRLLFVTDFAWRSFLPLGTLYVFSACLWSLHPPHFLRSHSFRRNSFHFSFSYSFFFIFLFSSFDGILFFRQILWSRACIEVEILCCCCFCHSMLCRRLDRHNHTDVLKCWRCDTHSVRSN